MHDFPTTSLIVFLSVAYGRTSRMGTLPMVLTRLPSVLVHELAHLSMAIATCAGVAGISLLPKRVEDGWVLGSVQCRRLTILNAFPVAMAPALIGLPLAWWTFQWGTLSGAIMTFLFLTAAVPSGQDIKVALSSLMGALLWVIGLFMGWQFIYH